MSSSCCLGTADTATAPKYCTKVRWRTEEWILEKIEVAFLRGELGGTASCEVREENFVYDGRLEFGRARQG